MTKKNVVVLFGGRSSEHAISCVTAAGVLQAIDTSRFAVTTVGITKAGETVLVPACEVLEYRLDQPELPEVRNTGVRVLWPAAPGERELQAVRVNEQGESVLSRLGEVDVVLPLLHGPYGEDGTVQGLFELIDLPYVGCDVLGSALCMDKHTAKVVWQAAGIQVAPWHTFTRDEFVRAEREGRFAEFAAEAVAGLSAPWFVKPSRAGSSVGVSKVSAEQGTPEFFAALRAAFETAFAEDSRVLVESGVVGREIELGVLGGRDGDAPRVSKVAGEIVQTGREFYDFEAKYLSAPGIELQLPAQVSAVELAQLQEAALLAFQVAGCRDISRVDFFLTPAGPVLNEINTLPGFTPFSMYPQLWEASGVPYQQLLTELLELALARAV